MNKKKKNNKNKNKNSNSNSNNNKGQIISGDFIISIAIFIMILSILVPLFNSMSDDMREKQLNEDLQTRMFFVSDSLLKTEGIPENWNQTNVKSLGLANADGRINKTKIKNLIRTPDTKTLLGLEGLEFNLSLDCGNYTLMTGVAASPVAYFYGNYKSMLGMINNSGLVWDMYYEGPGVADASDARNTYTGSSASMFGQMMNNSSVYRTIIIENTELTQAEVNITRLQEFLNTGGILILEGDPQLISGFGMHYNSTSNTSAVVMDEELIESIAGSIMDFNNSEYYFYHVAGDAVLHIAAQDTSSPGGASIGYWNSGLGRIYYIADLEGYVDSHKISEVMGLVGSKAELSTGQIIHSFAETRPIIIDTEFNSLGKATMVVGR